MWEIAAIISKEISEKDAKQHFKCIITLGKVEFCKDKFEIQGQCRPVGRSQDGILGPGFSGSILGFSQLAEIPAPDYIKTIQFKGQTAQSQLPIIRLGERLQLSFDALNGEEADFYYTITHHNFDWSESDLSKSEYLNCPENYY